MKNNTLKKKLCSNELTIGSWITIGHPSVVEILAPCGFDWLTVDMEHNAIDPSMLRTLIATIQFYDIAALVRVEKNEEVVIKTALDAGADGIIVPMVSSKAEAEAAVRYAKYPPRGRRGVGLSRAQKYGADFEGYKKWVDENLVVVAQIEHIDAIRNLEEIAQVDGIDGTFIGPYDLSGSMGMPGEYNKPEVIQALEQYKGTCRSLDESMGYHVVEPDVAQLRDKIDEGYRMLAFSTDFLFMGRNATDKMEQVDV